MLNTNSCTATAAIWAAIAAICGWVLWDLMGWPAPAVVLSQFLRSEAADALKQFQILVGAVVGFGIASWAYWFNGSQDRKAKAAATDKEARTLAHALMLETERLEADCDMAASRFASLAEEAGAKRSGDGVALPARDRATLRHERSDGLMLTELTPDEMARLGSNACSGLLMLRNSLADLDRETAALSRNSATIAGAELKDLARAFADVCLKCARLRPLLWTLSRHGTAMADAREPLTWPSGGDVEQHVKALGGRSQSPTAAGAGTSFNGPNPAMH